MRREHDYLARQGYVVLHVDYRSHATSSDDPDVDYELRLPTRSTPSTPSRSHSSASSTATAWDGSAGRWAGR